MITKSTEFLRALLTALIGAAFTLILIEAIRQQVGPWLWAACASGAYLVLFVWTAVRKRSPGKQHSWRWRLLESLLWFGVMLFVAILLNGSVGTAIAVGPINGHGVVWIMMLASLAASLGVILVLRPGPPAVWITLSILGAYAAGSVLLLLISGQLIDAALEGEAFWSVLPFWLQGPLVGLGFVGVASALLLAQVVKKNGKVDWVDALSLAAPTVAIIGILMLSPPDTPHSPQTSQDTTEQPAAVNSLPPLSIEVDSVLVVDDAVLQMREIAGQYGSADYDISTLAGRLGDDPDSAFAYVRDNIALDAYAGVLRGADGVLSARAGNSFDRALLLKSILDLQGHTTRLAVGELGSEAVSQLRAHVLSRDPNASKEEPILALAGMRGPPLDRFRARIGRDEAWLVDALGENIPTVRPTDESEIDASRHAWVQIERGEDWMDLDTSLPSNEPGFSLATLVSTMAGPDDSERHKISIRVIAESLNSSGALASETLLETQITSEEAARSNVLLAFSPEQSSQGLGAFSSASLLGESKYHPVLMVADEVLEGEIIPSTDSANEGGTSGETAQDFFFGGGDEDSAARLSALVLEVIVNSPRRGPVVKRRPLLDRLTSVQRESETASLEDLSPIEMAGDVPAAFAAVHQIVTSTGGANPYEAASEMANALAFTAVQMSTPEDAAELSLQNALWPMAELNSQIALASENLSIHMLNDHEAIRFYADAPRVFLLSVQQYRQAGEDGARLEIDLMHDRVGWIAGDSAETTDIIARRIRYGIAQSALETTLMELRALALGGNYEDVVSASTGLNTDWSVLSSRELDRGSARLPRALLSDAERGLTILLPAESGDQQAEIWWAFDKTNGMLAARLAPGLSGVWWVNEAGTKSIQELTTLSERLQHTANTSSCQPGNEYLTIFGCVSIKSSTAAGILVAIVVGIYAIIAGEILYYSLS